MVLLTICFGPTIVGLVLACLLPALFRARQGDPTLALTAAVCALTGIALLLIAKLPLYRRGKFLTFGLGALPGWYRTVYAVAYVFLGLSIGLLLLLLAVVR
jgi:hypothetical protein